MVWGKEITYPLDVAGPWGCYLKCGHFPSFEQVQLRCCGIGELFVKCMYGQKMTAYKCYRPSPEIQNLSLFQDISVFFSSKINAADFLLYWLYSGMRKWAGFYSGLLIVNKIVNCFLTWARERTAWLQVRLQVWFVKRAVRRTSCFLFCLFVLTL